MFAGINNSIWPQIFGIVIVLWIGYVVVYRHICRDCCTAEDLEAERAEAQLEILRNKCLQGEITKEKYEEIKRALVTCEVPRDNFKA